MNEERIDALARLDSAIKELERMLATGLDPRDFSDGDKLRMAAAEYDLSDAKRGVYDETEVQDDLRRIADLLDSLEREEQYGECSRCATDDEVHDSNAEKEYRYVTPWRKA